jgi:uncharacterized protein involved in outer membrane biogenesis
VKFFKQVIENKASALLGTAVTFGELSVSPLMGRVEATDVRIAGNEPGRPLLTIRRMEGRVSIARLVAGEFEIKSLVVEDPVVFLRLKQDGTFNLPRGGSSTPAEGKRKSEWKLEAESIRVLGGTFEFQRNSYVATAEKISGEMKCHRGMITGSLHIGVLARRDVRVDFGVAEVSGEIHDETISTGLADAPFRAQWRFESGLQLSVDCPCLSARRATVELHGPLDVKQWQAVLPDGLLPQALTVLNFSGPVNADIRLDITDTEGVHVREMNLRAAK